MARYNYSFRTGTPAAGANAFDIAAGAVHGAEIAELWLSNSAATAAVVGLIRTTAIGTRTSPTAMTNQTTENAPASSGTPELTVASAWSVAATLATLYLRRASIPAVIGGGFVWTFPEGLLVPISGSVMLVNLGAAAWPAMDATIVWDE
jgi:hypothetical protein